MTRGLRAYAVLLVIGAAWGISAPLIKIAVAAGHRPVAIVFWQSILATVVLGLVLAVTGQMRTLPRDAPHLRLYAVVGLCGMALPSWASYTATSFLPSGVVLIVISLVPVFALPLALVLGTERLVLRRVLGVAVGALAMALLMGPEASLPAPGLWVWVLVAALAPFFYAIEGAYVFGSTARGAGPCQMLWAGYVVSILTSAPLVWLDHAPLVPASGFGGRLVDDSRDPLARPLPPPRSPESQSAGGRGSRPCMMSSICSESMVSYLINASAIVCSLSMLSVRICFER